MKGGTLELSANALIDKYTVVRQCIKLCLGCEDDVAEETRILQNQQPCSRM
jgi:hypothetical protein